MGIAGIQEPPRQARPHHPARPRRCTAPRSGRPGLHRRCPQPAVGSRSDVRGDLGRGGLRASSPAFSRMIVGWRVASNMRTTMVLDALEMARWSRGITLPGLRCHSDAGSQFTSVRYGERLAEIGAAPSSRRSGTTTTTPWPRRSTVSTRPNWSTGRRGGRMETVGDLELATLGWVHWHNTNRLHGYLGDLPPARVRSHLLRYESDRPSPGRINSSSLHRNQGDSFEAHRSSAPWTSSRGSSFGSLMIALRSSVKGYGKC